MLAAGGLLEGCLRAPRPLAATDPGLQLLERVVFSSCSQAAAACARMHGRPDAGTEAEGDEIWRDAASLAVTELHQVLHLIPCLFC